MSLLINSWIENHFSPFYFYCAGQGHVAVNEWRRTRAARGLATPDLGQPQVDPVFFHSWIASPFIILVYYMDKTRGVPSYSRLLCWSFSGVCLIYDRIGCGWWCSWTGHHWHVWFENFTFRCVLDDWIYENWTELDLILFYLFFDSMLDAKTY